MTQIQRFALMRGALFFFLITLGVAYLTVYFWQQVFLQAETPRASSINLPLVLSFAVIFTPLTLIIALLDVCFWHTAFFSKDSHPEFDKGFACFLAKEFLPSRAEFQTLLADLLRDTKARLKQLAMFAVKLYGFAMLIPIGGLVAFLSDKYYSDMYVLYVLGSLLGLLIGLYGFIQTLITIWQFFVTQTLKS